MSVRRTPAAPISDDMLLAGLGAGDAEAAVGFVRRFQPLVFGVAVAVVGDYGLAEDIAQQAFERPGGMLRFTTHGEGRCVRG